MLGISELKVGTLFVMDEEPWKVVETQFVKMAQSTGVLQVKIKNLKTAVMLSRSFKQADKFEEAEISRVKAKFIFGHRGKYVFSKTDNASERFEFTEEQLGSDRLYLVQNLELIALRFESSIIAIELPSKVDLKVMEAPPAERGDTATGGKKTVVTETGLKVQAPLFIAQGDVIRVNTQSGLYVERVEKAL